MNPVEAVASPWHIVHCTDKPVGPEALVELNGIAVTLGGMPVLRNINLSTGKGEIYGLLEPNGAAPAAAVRFIQQGHYRLMMSALADGSDLETSPLVDFVVQPKPVVESARVLTIAFGIPLLLPALLFWCSGALSRISGVPRLRGWSSL